MIDRTTLASTATHSEVKIWHFKSDLRPYRYKMHKGAVNCCQFSSDGKILATGGQDGRVFLWKCVAEGDKHNANFTAHSAPVHSVVFSKDNNFLVTAGSDKIIKMWRVLNGYKKVKFNRSFVGHTNWVLKADISPDCNLIASVCDKVLKVWETGTAKEIISYRNVESGNRCLEFHPEGNYVAIGGGSGVLQVFDIRAMKFAQVYENEVGVNQISFHQNGVYLAVALDFNPRYRNSVLKVRRFEDFR